MRVARKKNEDTLTAVHNILRGTAKGNNFEELLTTMATCARDKEAFCKMGFRLPARTPVLYSFVPRRSYIKAGRYVQSKSLG